MNKVKSFKLKKKELDQLQLLIRKGSAKARVITRARVLLLLAKGKSPSFILESLDIKAFRTIHNIKKRYFEGGLENSLYDKPRPGAPTLFDGKHRAEITALACTDAPEGHARWSLSLLADKAVELNIVENISRAHVGRILKKTK